MDELTIRQADEADDAALAAIERAVWAPDNSPTPKVEGEPPFFGPGREPSDTWVATIGDRIVGSVLVGAGHPIPSHSHVAHLRGLSVHPDAQGLGVGRALVERAVGELARRGARRVRSRVLSTNAGSLALHARCGFVEEGRLRGEFLIDGVGAVDDVLLAFCFDDPPAP